MAKACTGRRWGTVPQQGSKQVDRDAAAGQPLILCGVSEVKLILEIINSRENTGVKKLARLVSSKKERDRQGLFVCEGARLCLDGLRSGHRPLEVYTTARARGKYSELFRLVEAAEKACQITEEIAAKVTDTTTPQGVLAVFKKLDNWKTTDTIKSGAGDFGESRKFVLLSQVQDPGNLGSVMRSCEAFGVDGLLLSSGCADVYSPKALRASMGGVFRLPVAVDVEMREEIAALRALGVKVYAAALQEGAISVRNCDFSGSSAIVIGNEGSGLAEEIAEACTGAVVIPMAGQAESLNAGVAAGILIWEMAEAKREHRR